MALRFIDVILGYSWFFNKKSSLFVNFVNHSIILNILFNMSKFHLFSSYHKSFCSTTFCCALNLELEIYNVANETNQVTYYEQQRLLDLLLSRFQDAFLMNYHMDIYPLKIILTIILILCLVPYLLVFFYIALVSSKKPLHNFRST